MIPKLRDYYMDKRTVIRVRAPTSAGAALMLLGVTLAMSAWGSCFPPAAGLFGWWPGEGNANDIQGINNGTLQGGASATAVGIVGQAFSFDGTNSYVQIPNNVALQPANWTIEAWVLFASLDSSGSGGSPAGDQYIVFKQNTRTSDFEGFDLSKTRVAGGDVFRLLVTSATAQTAEIHSSTILATGVWYHVAAVRGSNYTQVYVNGNLERQTNVTFAQNYGPLPLYFGTSGQSYWDHKLKGLLDEVSFYNRALSASEVASIYGAGAAGKCKVVNGLSITTQPQSQSVAPGSNALFTAAAAGTAPLGYQWWFNGTAIAGATNTNLALLNVQPANGGSYTVVVTNATAAITSAVAVLTVVLPPVITTQPQSQAISQGGSATFTVVASGTPPLYYQWSCYGTNLPGATGSSYTRANAQSADAGPYSVLVSNTLGTAASSSAVLTVIVPGGCLPPLAGLIGWWPGDGNANDLTGSDNGTLQGGATATAAGMVAQAFSFNGTNNYVQIPDSPILRPANLTIEAWVRFSSLNSAGSGGSPAGDQYIVFKQNTRSSDFEGFDLSKTRIAGGDVFRFLVTSATAQAAEIHSSTLLATGVWYHVAAMRGSNFTRIYVNGRLESQTNIAFAQDYGTLPLCFGTSGQSGWDHKLSGLLDEVSLYNRALSSNEVAAIYSAGAAGKCKVVTGLSITAQPQSQSVVAGGNTVFTVAVAGAAPLNYQWKFNGVAMPGATGTSLVLTGVQAANGGSYVVVVTNSTASATSAVAVLTVLPGAGTVTVNGAQTYQVIDGFGVNANHRSWNNNELMPVLDALIDQAGMTLFHVIFDNNNWEGVNDNSDANMMDWTYFNTVYSAPDFQKLWGIMAYLNQRGITSGLVPTFQGPVALWMGGLSLTPGYENEYAETIASALIYARNTQHLQFTAVGPVNEPDNTYAGIHLTGAAQYVAVMHALSQQLDNKGLSDVRFSGPDLAHTTTSWLTQIMTDPVVMAKLAHFGLHSYQGVSADATGVYSFLQQSAYPDRHFWMTEFGVWCANCQNSVSGDNSWAYARGTASYLLNLLAEGASAGIVWEGYDSQYTDFNAATGGNNPVHWSYWGLLAVDNINSSIKTYTPRKGFYTLAQIAKFVRPGAQRINVSGVVSPLSLLAFYNTNSGQLTLAGVNPNSSASSLSCALRSLPTIPSLDLYYTSSTTNLCYGAHVAVINGTFSVVVPADCVFTLTYSNLVATAAAQQGAGSITPPTLSCGLTAGGVFQLAIAGQPLQQCVIEVSDDLVDWAELATATLQVGTTLIPAPATASRQFYRARLLP